VIVDQRDIADALGKLETRRVGNSLGIDLTVGEPRRETLDRPLRVNMLTLLTLGLVPGGGVEPPRPEGRRILSPLRLPVPPSRRGEATVQQLTADSQRFARPV